MGENQFAREGNGNPLQCSCLEDLRDGGAWWAVISGVAQSWTQLKRLSSNSDFGQHILMFRAMFLLCWRICLVCLALELVGPWVVLGFSVGMEAFG